MLRLLCMKLMILCLFLLCALPGGEAAVSLHKANIDLSNNAIIDIYQDDRGYMWIGTYDGLNLFNGRNTYVYRFEPDNKIPFAVTLSIKSQMAVPGISGCLPRWD